MRVLSHYLPLMLAGLVALSACSETVPPTRSLALANGEILATTPAGYCVDLMTSDAANGFAVMAPCATLGTQDKVPDALGVATVQVGPPDSGSVAGAEPALQELLDSDAGAVLLSSSGDAAAVDVFETAALENTVTVHFSDSGIPAIDGLGTEEWRAFTDVNGRLVTVAVRGLTAAPLSEGTGSWLLALVVNGLLAQTVDLAVDAPQT